MSRLVAAPDGLQVHTPYNADFVNELKYIIPYAARRWNRPYWIVDPQYGQDVADLIQRYFNEQVSVPATALTTGPELRIIRVDYIGRCKDGAASGFCSGSWSVRLPEPLLRTWFCDEVPAAGDQVASGVKSLYTDLGIKNFSEFDQIKLAYRRMAKQWHPDVCREPNATERFQAINHAYDVLKDDRLRRKYDCGLIFQERAEQPARPRHFQAMIVDGYRTPLRCGLIAAMGTLKLGQFWLESILKWDDILDSAGRTMIASWSAGAETFQIDWS